MKNYLFFLILIGLVSSCNKEQVIENNCSEVQLGQLGMIGYSGQELECRFFLELYHYQNKQYYILGNHCADLISYPTDCDGNTFCEEMNERNCTKFYKKAVKIGIVGITK